MYKPPLASEKKDEEEEWEGDERMKGVDKKLAKLILSEIMDKGNSYFSACLPPELLHHTSPH